jgi:group I intron endonuclease
MRGYENLVNRGALRKYNLYCIYDSICLTACGFKSHSTQKLLQILKNIYKSLFKPQKSITKIEVPHKINRFRKMGYIYKITNKISKKCYIGVTKEDTPEKRWNAHIHTLKNNTGCPALKDAMASYGVENFKFEVIIICFDEDLYRFEIEYIKKYNSMVPNGYNILPGGQCGGGFKGKKHNKESITKMVEGVKKFREANPDHFETYRERHKEAMDKIDLSARLKNSEKYQKAKQEGRLGSNSHKTLLMSEETKQKIRETVTKYFQENGPNECNIEKHRKAMAKSKGKPVIQYTNEGEFVKQYESICDAGRLSGVNHNNIRRVLYKYTKTAGGYIWKYAPKLTE